MRPVYLQDACHLAHGQPTPFLLFRKGLSEDMLDLAHQAQVGAAAFVDTEIKSHRLLSDFSRLNQPVRRLFIACLVLHTQNLKRFAIQFHFYTVHDPVRQSGNLELACLRHTAGSPHTRPVSQLANHFLYSTADVGGSSRIVPADPGRNVRDVPSGTP